MNGKLQVRIESNGCDRTKNHVAYLEHVQAKVTITSSRRGDMQIYLISPQGTRSTLLARRVRDNSGEGFNDWAFMTTHSWGETSKGRWTLEVENLSSICKYRLHALFYTTLSDWSINSFIGRCKEYRTLKVASMANARGLLSCRSVNTDW